MTKKAGLVPAFFIEESMPHFGELVGKSVFHQQLQGLKRPNKRLLCGLPIRKLTQLVESTETNIFRLT
jgi:hypothetical protein